MSSAINVNGCFILHVYFILSLEISKFVLALQYEALVNTSERVLFSSPVTHVNKIHLVVLDQWILDNLTILVILLNGKLLWQYRSDFKCQWQNYIIWLNVVYNFLSIYMLYGFNDGKVLAC